MLDGIHASGSKGECRVREARHARHSNTKANPRWGSKSEGPVPGHPASWLLLQTYREHGCTRSYSDWSNKATTKAQRIWIYKVAYSSKLTWESWPWTAGKLHASEAQTPHQYQQVSMKKPEKLMCPWNIFWKNVLSYSASLAVYDFPDATLSLLIKFKIQISENSLSCLGCGKCLSL